MSVVIKKEADSRPRVECLNEKVSTLSSLDLEIDSEKSYSNEPLCSSASKEKLSDNVSSKNIKDEVSEATEDESMAVEALWQLGGGGYNEKDESQRDTIYTESPEPEPVRYPVIKSTYTLIQCEDCSISFPTETDLQLHLSSCENRIKKLFTCNICTAIFDTKINYDNHIICHEVVRPYSCRSCGMLFKLKGELQSHSCQQMLRNLQCNICGLEFSRASSLTNHMKVHTYTPGRGLAEFTSMTSDPSLLEPVYSSTWSPNENQSLPPLLPQLDIQSASFYHQSSSDISGWNMNHLGLPEDLPDSMDIAQEMTVNTTSYLNVLNSQPSFQSEFDEMNGSGDSLEYNHIPDKERMTLTQQNQIDLVSDSINFPVKVEILKYPIAAIKDTQPVLLETIQEDLMIKKKPHSCKYCGVSFTRAKALVSHERLHQDYSSDFFECNKCGDVFVDIENQKNHVCNVKPNLMKSQATKTHIATSSQVTSKMPTLENTSELDEYSVNDQGSSLSTNLVKQKQTKHACQQCSKRFTTKQKMFRHMWIHREKTFSCEICGETFSLQSELDNHRLSSHPTNSPHGCAICGKCFASRQGLWEHARSHREGVAPHSCPQCGKAFSSRQGFLIHTRTHTGERPYGCRYCWKAFRDGGTLRKHERIHTGERPHVCPLCWRAFNQKVVLREHVRWVHAAPSGPAEPPYPCPLCPQLLPDKEDLCAHIVKHSDTIAAKDKQKPPGDAPKLTIKKDLFLPDTVNQVTNPLDDKDKVLIPCISEPSKSSDDETKSFTCDMCSHLFSSRHQLLEHVRIHI